jgi:ABC-type transport system involved in cytochrome bd biosynthesis fused ATPase/permease subunit
MNNFIKQILPWVGAAATGGVPALIGMAAKTVGDVIGAQVGNSADEIINAIAGATPDQILALKKADQDFALQMQAMGFKQASDLEKIAADDRANAREREKTIRDATPMCLAAGITIGFFLILAYMVRYGINEQGGDAMLVMLGALGAAFSGVINYYFGSSSGSAQKNEIIGKLKG